MVAQELKNRAMSLSHALFSPEWNLFTPGALRMALCVWSLLNLFTNVTRAFG